MDLFHLEEEISNMTLLVIIAVMTVVIILHLFLDVVVIMTFIIWYCGYRKKENGPKTKNVSSKEFNMSPKRKFSSHDPYYNLGKDLSGEPQYYAETHLSQMEGKEEAVYARINEQRDPDPDISNKDVVVDGDYEIMKSDNPQKVVYSNVSF